MLLFKYQNTWPAAGWAGGERAGNAGLVGCRTCRSAGGSSGVWIVWRVNGRADSRGSGLDRWVDERAGGRAGAFPKSNHDVTTNVDIDMKTG